MKDYEDALRRAHSEGWRDPIEITNMEIRAYEAGMRTERKRVMSILSKAADGSPMRVMDLLREMDKIKNPNQ